MPERFGTHRATARVQVNHKSYRDNADDIREHSVELRVDIDKVFDRLAAKACRSKAGKATAMHGAVVCKRIK